MRLISKAISSLCPGSEFIIEDENYDTIQWLVPPTNIPTLDELHLELDRLEQEEIKKIYKKQRILEYPSLQEQLDMLWHMMDDDIIPGKDSQWYNTILSVKQKYPKQG